MNTRENYIISPRTAAFFLHYELEHEYTLVIQQNRESFIVRQTPDEFIRSSFCYFGINLEESIQSARKILKKDGKVPIPLSAEQNLILICCKALNHNGNIGIISSQIQGIYQYRINKSTVLLKNGLSFHVDSKVKDLQEQRKSADYLYKSLVKQIPMQKTRYYLYYRETDVVFALETRPLKYCVKQDKEDDEDLDLDLVL